MPDQASTPSHRSARRRSGRRTAWALLGAALAIAGGPAAAHAADPYGESHRIGGFDSTYFNNGGYDGSASPAAGRFLNPTVFAVDTADGGTAGQTAVYVLDRTSGTPADGTPTSYRLQKLAESGAVLGTASFTLPGAAQTLPETASLAVESGSPGRVHLLLNTADGAQPRAILAWSTAVSGGKLESPAGLTPDAITTATGGSNPAGVVATAAQLGDGGALSYPSGLAVAGTGAARTLAVLSRVDDDPYGGKLSRVTLTAGGGRAVGDKLAAEWLSSTALTGIPNATATTNTSWPTFNGLARDPDGGLTVLFDDDDHLGSPAGAGANLNVVRLDAELGSPRILSSVVNSAGGLLPGAANLNLSPWAAISAPISVGRATPAAQVAALAGGRYAALFASNYAYNPTPSLTWGWKAASGGDPTRANLAVRLLAPVAAAGQPWDGTLSNPEVPTRSIVNTIGNPAATGACAIALNAGAGRQNVGVAAGAGGAIWVLTGGDDAAILGTRSDGRELIEFEPGAGGQACPQPTAGLRASSGGRDLDTSAPVAVPVAGTVDFDAAAARGGGWVSQYDWDLDGDGAYETVTRWNGETESPLLATARKQYTRPGQVVVRARLTGDFGVVERTVTLFVQASERPTAAFTPNPSSALKGATVAFDAGGSRAPTGTRLTNYHWDYGDSVVEDSATPAIDHVYTAAGTYTVRLTVRGSDNQVSAAASQTVTITDPVKPPERRIVVDPPIDVRPPVLIPPTPRDTTAPAISLKLAGAREAVAATIGCPAGESSCRGTVTLSVTTRVRVGRGRRARTTTRVVTVGQAGYSAAGGASATVTVRLNAAGKALLKRAASLKVTVAVSATDAAGNVAPVKKGAATIRRAARRAARSRRR